MKAIGLIAGNRSFPLLFSQEARKDPDIRLVVAAFKGEADRRIAVWADKVCWVTPGRVRDIIEFFRREGVTDLVMAGQISPWRIFASRRHWDDLALNIAARIRDFRPHSIFGEFIKVFESEGFRFLSSLTCMGRYIAVEGVNNGVGLNECLESEINRAVELARDIVELDIGQTVVFKNKAIVALEALEGTDNTIRRGRKVCGTGFVVVKRATHNQDLRFDVPVIGTRTLSLLSRCRAKALVVHAGKTLILDKEKTLAIADKAGIPIVGVK
jgi:DUF1009 family protein